MRVESRKLQRLGTSSLVVTLPRSWVKKHDLKPGDEVFVYDEGSSLRIVPVRAVQKGLSVRLKPSATMEVSEILRGITCLYIMGYNDIQLDLSGLSISDLSKVKEVTLRLAGIEVVDEDTSRLRIRYLVDTSRLDVKLTIRSMGIVVARVVDMLNKLLSGELDPMEAARTAKLVREELMRHQHSAMRYLVGRIAEGDSSNAYALLMGTGLLGLIGDLLLDIVSRMAPIMGELGSDIDRFKVFVKELADTIPALASILVGPSYRRTLELLEKSSKLLSRASDLASSCRSNGCAYLAGKLENVARVAYIVSNIAFCSAFASEKLERISER
jgi:phosphate uptake regulator